MANAVCMNPTCGTLIDTSKHIFCIATDLFAHAFVKSLGGLLPAEILVAKSVPSAIDLLYTTTPRLVIWPALQRDMEMDESIHDVSLARGAAYLPITLVSMRLEVGPLFSRGRSCVRCWNLRRKQHDNEKTTAAICIPDSEQHCYLSASALMSAALSLSIVERGCGRFTSPIWRLEVASNRAAWSTLTSSAACLSCRQEFDLSRDTSSELETLIEGIVKEI